jgi:hypothetical protein
MTAKAAFGQPRRDVGRDEVLTADGLRELNHHEESDCRREADANAVSGASALRARGKWRAEQCNDEARNGNGDLECPLHSEEVRVASGPLQCPDEPGQLGEAHLLRIARPRP